MEQIQQDVQAFALVVSGLRSQGKRVVMAVGVFDLLHVGHIKLLEDARSRGDYLIVALQSDAAARRAKGDSRPLQTAADRAVVLTALSCVHYVTFYDAENASALVRLLKPAFVVRGYDTDAAEFPERAAAEEVGTKTLLAGDTKARSVEQILEKVHKGAKRSVTPAKHRAPKSAAVRRNPPSPARAAR